MGVLQAGYAVLSMRTHQLLARDYYVELHRPYATSLLTDQHHGAYATWLLGVLPLLLLAGLVTRRHPLIASDSQVI